MTKTDQKTDQKTETKPDPNKMHQYRISQEGHFMGRYRLYGEKILLTQEQAKYTTNRIMTEKEWEALPKAKRQEQTEPTRPKANKSEEEPKEAKAE